MEPIRVVVHGASGRMGREVLAALCHDPELKVVGAVEKEVTQEQFPLPDGSVVPFSSDLESILKNCCPEVLVDFTIAEASRTAAQIATRLGVNLVVGTTGLSDDDLNEIDHLSQKYEVGAVVAPNFALGAVLMTHLAKVAAKFFDYAEIIELHHHQKADAPSGTALSTAKAMLTSRGKPFIHPSMSKENLSSRGEQVDGITLHSVRLPGLLAHQEVILGGPGQTLTIRHDTISRECYMPGIIMAIKEVVKRRGLVYGLDALLGL